MATRKKKTGKQKKQPQFKRHYCKICGEHKANEKFSGKGHAAHICKSCASKSPEQKSEDMTINKLHGMAFRYISEMEMKWLKNRRNVSHSEVRELACQVFSEKFPRQARNEIKQQLHIRTILFYVRGEIYDGYGDEHSVNIEYVADTSGKIIRKSYEDNNVLTNEKIVEIGQSAIRKFFNVMVHNHDISFWETDLCLEISYEPDIDLPPEYYDEFDDGDFEDDDDEPDQLEADGGEVPDDREPTWNVEIEYKNGTKQNTKGYDDILDPVISLFLDFEEHFENEYSNDDFDGEDIGNLSEE